MNNKLIEKVIQTNLGTCPSLHYRNPVLDRNVAKALAKSFVKILALSANSTDTPNSTVHNNLRISILEYIRKMCVVEPENHVPVNENLSEALCEIYIKHIQSISKPSIEKDLDAFLIKRLKAINVISHYKSTVNPEIIQALLNLNDNGVYLEILAKDIMHWDTKKDNFIAIIKDLWKTDKEEKCAQSVYNDLAIKIKPEIENTILNVCHSIMNNKILDLDSLFSDNSLIELTKRCSISLECFQICIGALNFIFIMTNFDSRLQNFIPAFINRVKLYIPEGSFSALYPIHLNYVVVMLDFEINTLPEPLKANYITPTLKLMKELRERSEHDFIMLLSHFPQWFDIYFQDKN